MPSRLEANADCALALLERAETKATFLAGAWVAERYPALIARIAGEGHEIGCQVGGSSEGEVLAAKRRLEAASGQIVLGAGFDHRAFLQAEHVARLFDYSCNLVPLFGPRPTFQTSAIPIPSIRFAGRRWPARSFLLRHLGDAAAARIVSSWAWSDTAHPLAVALWELDDDAPDLATQSAFAQWSSRRNIPAFRRRLQELLTTARFAPARETLGLSARKIIATAAQGLPREPKTVRKGVDAPAMSIVVPCFNEEAGLPYLRNALDALSADAAGPEFVRFTLVDDGSTDGTWSEMHRLFGDDHRFHLLKHDRNRGIGAAIMTGIADANTEIVAVIDSDCSYDPAKIWDMLPLLGPRVAAVTASPYHPEGGVEGVPAWRLMLSKGASRLYRLILSNKLATYTSCFRLYRRSAVAPIKLRHDGFIGVAELLARLDQRGWRIAEHPTVLESRLFGQSKLKVMRTVAGHVELIGELALARVMTGRRPAAPEVNDTELERLP